MTRREALEVLGLIPEHYPIEGPLNDSQKIKAKERFDTLFDANKKVCNMYLQGKVSGAYRTLVDPKWDKMNR